MDLDVKTNSDLDFDFDAVMSVIQRRACEFFDEDLPRVIVCGTPPVTTDGVTKAGRHLVWTNVRVRTPIALAFRQAVVVDLVREMPDAFCGADEDGH